MQPRHLFTKKRTLPERSNLTQRADIMECPCHDLPQGIINLSPAAPTLEAHLVFTAPALKTTSSLEEPLAPDSAAETYTITPQEPSLVGLPLEIRQQIYRHVFHEQPKSCHQCEVFDLRLGSLGCLCGEGLSRANRKLYRESRSRYYNCARFIFKNVSACKRFLDDIGHNTMHISALAVTYKNEYAQLDLLRYILGRFRKSESLHALQLTVEPWDGHLKAGPPIYLPTARQEYTDADFYDWTLRYQKHPLAHLSHLRSLTIQGHPGTGEVEEAIFKASSRIKQLAQGEGHNASTTEDYYNGMAEWFYKIEVK